MLQPLLVYRNGAAYVRVSTDKQEELSPDAQKRLILDYAKKNHILISPDDIYIENGISGRKADKRPEFQKMIAMAKSKNHPYDVILVWKFSRFARNQEESIVYKSMLKRDNVDVISISEPLVEGPFGSLIERIIEWMDEYYSIRLSGEVFRGMSENAMRGNFQARPPLGYTVPYRHATPVIVPEEAEIVQLIFNMYTDQGLSMFEIAKRLNALGYLTSRQKKFERRSIDYILKNPTYIGKTVWNQHHNLTNTKKPEEEWIIADGSHEPIISNEQFEKAQNRYKSEYTPKNQKPVETHRHWLSGLVKCSTCGRSLSTSVHKDARYGRTYVNFQCYGYLKGKCSVSHQISEKKLVPKVLEGISSVLNSGELYFTVVPQKNSAPSISVGILQERLKDIEKKMLRIKESYHNGIDTLDEYKENKEILLNEKSQLESKISEINNYKPDTAANKIELLRQLSDVYNLLLDESASVKQKGESIRQVVEKIVYDKENQSIQIFYHLSKPLL